MNRIRSKFEELKKSGKKALIPYIKAKPPLNGKPTAYVCEQYVCKLPVTRVEQLQTLLDREP